jgi:hypothetical protein
MGALSEKFKSLLSGLSLLGFRQHCHASLHVSVKGFDYAGNKGINALWLVWSFFQPRPAINWSSESKSTIFSGGSPAKPHLTVLWTIAVRTVSSPDLQSETSGSCWSQYVATARSIKGSPRVINCDMSFSSKTDLNILRRSPSAFLAVCANQPDARRLAATGVPYNYKSLASG